MGKSLSRLNLAVATVFAASLGWLAVAGLSNGTLGGLLTLHRTGPGEIPLAPRANPAVPAVASEMPPLRIQSERPIIPVAGISPDQLFDTFSQARAG